MDAHQTSLFTAILITCIVLGLVITYFTVTIIRHQRRNIELYKSKIVAEITTLERERTRIAHDLHDELGPILSSVKLRINNIDVGSPDDAEQLAFANKHLDDIIQQMRTISNDLLPVTLQRKGLISAVNESIQAVGQPEGLTIRFIYEDVPALPKDISVNLFRILQEVMHNAIKHARATELKIALTVKDNSLQILCEDNGVGFDYNALFRDSSGLGLRSLLNRTEMMKGEMFVESKNGQGSKFIFNIPLS